MHGRLSPFPVHADPFQTIHSNRPNLRQLIPLALGQGSWFGEQFTGQLQPNQTQRWFTFSWPEHWRVV
jgi:hypothetical protein